jgi:hypothetical protein
MNISATLDGEAVSITSITGNGTDIYISYVDASSVLKFKKDTISMGDESITLATSATIV